MPFYQMLSSAEQFGFIVEGKKELCLSLIVAGLLGDEVATLQLGDLLEENGKFPYLPEKHSCMGESIVHSIKVSRKQYRRFSKEKKATFRKQAKDAGVYSTRRKKV